MIASPGKKLTRIRGRYQAIMLAAAVAFLVSVSTGGEAQTPQLLAPPTPTKLTPPKPQSPTQLAPAQLAPAQLAPAQLDPAPAVTQQPVSVPSSNAPELAPFSLRTNKPGLTPVRIDVQSLQTTDADSVGTLTEDEGGFGIDMWEDTSRSRVERLMPKLPVNSSSRTMRSLMRRLLLSTAKAPEGEPVSPKAGKDLIGTRIELLASMGDIKSVTELLKVIPPGRQSGRLLKSEVDMLFLRNDNARVCSLVASQIKEVDTPYWQKAFIFCQSLAGEHDKASLGASMLRDTGDDDEVFFGVLDTLAGVEKFQVASLANPQPLHFAMMRASRTELPADVTSANNPAILRTIATTPNARPELRVDAAERAEAMGALNTDILRQLYAGVSFTDEALNNPLTTADAERSPLSRALLYRKALVESVPAAIAEVLANAFKLAREEGRFQSMARVYLPILRGIDPTQDFIWFAPDAIRAFLAAADFASAAQWFSVLRSTAAVDERAATIRNSLMPLARLAGAVGDDEWTPEMLAGWWTARMTSTEETQVNPEKAAAEAALLYELLTAFEDEVPASQWEHLLDGPPQGTTIMPQPALWRSLASATEQARVGETVLLSLLTLGRAGPTQANPTVLHRVVTSLRQVGLEEDARALALEAALASGI